MNQFEKEFGLSSKFPSYKLKENKLKQVLSEVEDPAVLERKHQQSRWKSRTANILAYAATLILTFSLIFGYITYQRAALFKEQKIETDISVGIEKVRVLIDKTQSENSGIDSPKEVNEFLSKYFSSNALYHMEESVALLKDKEIRTEESYNTLIAGKPVEIVMTNIIKSDGIKVEKLGNKEISVMWFDEILSKNVSVKCKLESKRWIITNISI
jgi:hypothetical protein